MGLNYETNISVEAAKSRIRVLRENIAALRFDIKELQCRIDVARTQKQVDMNTRILEGKRERLSMYKQELTKLTIIVKSQEESHYNEIMTEYNRQSSIQDVADRYFRAMGVLVMYMIRDVKDVDKINKDTESIVVEINIPKNSKPERLPKYRHFSLDEDERKEFPAKSRENKGHKATARCRSIRDMKRKVAKRLIENGVNEDTVMRSIDISFTELIEIKIKIENEAGKKRH